MDYKSILKKILIPNKKGIDQKKLNKILHNQNKYINIYNFLLNIYNDSYSINETLKRLQLNIDIKPLCPICRKPVNFIGKQSKMFSKYCSNSCRAKDSKNINRFINSQKKYNIEHYGVEFNFQRPDCKEKRKQSLINHYGTDKLYLVDEIKEKSKISTNKIKDKIINHRNNTFLKKYNIDSFGKLLTLDNIKQKRFETIKLNNSFNISKEEDKSYVLLKEKYSDVIRQYKSDLYPFACDFYIPSLDLYIECNYHWTHGYHHYNSNDIYDQNKVKLWKSKQTKYYDNAIKTWTDLDIRKRNIVKENKLNYIIFWDINELKNWLNNN